MNQRSLITSPVARTHHTASLEYACRVEGAWPSLPGSAGGASVARECSVAGAPLSRRWRVADASQARIGENTDTTLTLLNLRPQRDMRERLEPKLTSPFGLSLSKPSPSFMPPPLEEERHFDKLSANGLVFPDKEPW